MVRKPMGRMRMLLSVARRLRSDLALARRDGRCEGNLDQLTAAGLGGVSCTLDQLFP